jgi:hypothetical protein
VDSDRRFPVQRNQSNSTVTMAINASTPITTRPRPVDRVGGIDVVARRALTGFGISATESASGRNTNATAAEVGASVAAKLGLAAAGCAFSVSATESRLSAFSATITAGKRSPVRTRRGGVRAGLT